MKCAIDPSTAVTENEDIQKWVLTVDHVLVRAAAVAVSTELEGLVAHFKRKQDYLKAAKVLYIALYNKSSCF